MQTDDAFQCVLFEYMETSTDSTALVSKRQACTAVLGVLRGRTRGRITKPVPLTVECGEFDAA